MTDARLREIYDRFNAMYANSRPIRAPTELDAAIQAAGLGYEQITADWLRALRHAWVYHESDEPFFDEQHNRAYRRNLAL